ncbi:MAG: sigma-54 dependent transcriptional regulator [Myxococcota bacterium]|jgi:DNA-binding NtrC family response regulator|nr:sigma-54 dependent transcriptional regulator [Myxococcota bacterium]
MKLTMLIVEDDQGVRSSLERSFERKGYRVMGAATVEAATRLLSMQKVDLLLLDIRLPDGSGLDLLAAARDLDEEILVIMMTAYPEIKTAVDAIKGGAHDFVIKPFELEEIHLTVARAAAAFELRRKVSTLERESEQQREVRELIGESAAIQSVHRQIRKVANADVPVLVMGDTGTGKELVASSIHRLSSRAQAPLVTVNCSTFSEQLLESELFGHEKGAFTDAKQARAGLFEMADGGTLFLDEVSEMRLELQAKLLRVVEGQPFRRIGGQRELRTNVRLVAATNRHMEDLVEEGRFRADLYFRLNVFRIDVPPLRDRGDDIVKLAQFFLGRFSQASGKSQPRLTGPARNLLLAYDWPGNVRELRGVIERAALLCEAGEIGPEDLPAEMHASSFVRRETDSGSSGKVPTLRQIESRYIAHVLQLVDGNLSEAARVLGIARNTLKSKMRGRNDGTNGSE